MNWLDSISKWGTIILLVSTITIKCQPWTHKFIFKWTGVDSWNFSFQESEQPSVEHLKMWLRKQDLTHTFTINQSIPHTHTHTPSLVWEWIKPGDSLSSKSLYPSLIEPKTVSIRASNHQSLVSSNNPSIFSVFASCKWQTSPAPPLPLLPTHRAVFSTPVNDKTMQLCYLTTDGDYGPVEAWCLSSAGWNLPAPHEAFTLGASPRVKHLNRLEPFPAEWVAAWPHTGPEALLFFYPFSVICFVLLASQV